MTTTATEVAALARLRELTEQWSGSYDSRFAEWSAQFKALDAELTKIGVIPGKVTK